MQSQLAKRTEGERWTGNSNTQCTLFQLELISMFQKQSKSKGDEKKKRNYEHWVVIVVNSSTFEQFVEAAAEAVALATVYQFHTECLIVKFFFLIFNCIHDYAFHSDKKYKS